MEEVAGDARELLSKSWRSVLEMLSTSTLSIILFCLLIPVVIGVIAAVAEHHKRPNVPLIDVFIATIQPTLITVLVTACAIAILVCIGMVRTVMANYRSAINENKAELATQKETLATLKDMIANLPPPSTNTANRVITESIVRTFDWKAEWIQMESDFVNIDDPRIYADCRPNQHTDGDTWYILRDIEVAPEIETVADLQRCKSFCDLAGSKLMASIPTIPVSAHVKSQTEDYVRWLCYLRETENDDFMPVTHSFSKHIAKPGGHIPYLTRVSVNACIKCRATTYPKQP